MKDLLRNEKTKMVYKTQMAVYLIMLIASNLALLVSLWDQSKRLHAGLILNGIFISITLGTFIVYHQIKNVAVKNVFFLIGALAMSFGILLITIDKSVLGLVIFSGPVLLMIFNNFNRRYNIIGVVSFLITIALFAYRSPVVSVQMGLGFYVLCMGAVLSMGVAMKYSHDLFWQYDEKLKEKVNQTEEKNLALLSSLAELEQSEETIKSQYMEISNLNAANQQVIDRLKAIVDAGDDGIIDIDLERQVVHMTAKATHILGQSFSTPQQLSAFFNQCFDPGDAIAFNHLLEVLQFHNPEQKTQTTRELAYQYNNEAKFLKFNGLTYKTTQLDYDNHLPGRHMVLVVKDVTSEFTKAQHIYQMAYMDPLTGLSNRTAFIERAHEAISLQGVDQIAIMVFDIDNFKYINDSFGFALGDQLLRQVGTPLKDCLSKEHVCPANLLSVARFDGDAFGLMWSGEDFDNLSKQFYQWIVENLSAQTLEQTHIHLTFSAGVAESPDPNFALTAAEIAMYKTKERGRATFSKFDPGYLQEVQRHHQLTTALEEALEIATRAPEERRGQQLSLYYQPIYHIQSGNLASYEALARWHHPTLGAIPPDEFIAVAEKSGQILTLGQWVQREAMRFAKSSGHRVCINVSPMQLLQTDDFAGQLIKALDDHQIPRDSFGIEVTESVLVQDRLRANEQLITLKEAGIAVALDDFGSGYSSLSYLIDLPISTLKIDKAFIRPICQPDQLEANIVGTILQLATQLGLSTVAEGVEREDQLNILTQLGCTLVQGYLFSRPIPESQVPPKV